MIETTIEHLKKQNHGKIIGVIGATIPDQSYSEDIGLRAGYLLRQHVEDNGGHIFTGGVTGVGIDVYTGIMKFCINKGLKSGKMPDDRFFILVPKFSEIQPIKSRVMMSENFIVADYQIPKEYICLSRLNTESDLKVILAGDNLSERRVHVAEIADTVIMINGSRGTLDEAIMTLNNNKEVIVVRNSGGAAEFMTKFKSGTLGIQAQQIIRYGIDISSANKSLIRIVNDVTEISAYLQ